MDTRSSDHLKHSGHLSTALLILIIGLSLFGVIGYMTIPKAEAMTDGSCHDCRYDLQTYIQYGAYYSVQAVANLVGMKV